ncbi:hypothetical protein GCM10027168_63090 [Streptomyces capparidis]
MAEWLRVTGALVRIAVGSRTNVWGVNAGGNIYRYTNNDASPWVQMPGAATDIGAAADGTVWHVNSAGSAYRWTADATGTPWQQVPGTALKAISAGSRTNVWGGADDAIHRFTTNDASPWAKARGSATDVAAGADGTVWHIYNNGEIYRWTGDQPG